MVDDVVVYKHIPFRDETDFYGGIEDVSRQL